MYFGIVFDTFFRWAFVCPHVVVTRAELVPAEIQQLAERLLPDSLFASKLWTPRPGKALDQCGSALGSFCYQIDGVDDAPFDFEEADDRWRCLPDHVAGARARRRGNSSVPRRTAPQNHRVILTPRLAANGRSSRAHRSTDRPPALV